MISLTKASTIRTSASVRGGSVLARMIRLWLEHPQRMAEYGIRPV